MSMPMLRCAALACMAFMAAASQENPVSSVITLLTNLKGKIEGEGTAEATTYDTYACFCRDQTKLKSDAITSGQDQIDGLSDGIAQKDATRTENQAELKDNQKTHEETSAAWAKEKARCQAEETRFEGEIADLTKANTALQGAIDKMTTAKTSIGFMEVDKSQDLTASLSRVLQQGPVGALADLLQQGVDPKDPGFKYHSEKIMDTLKKLQEEFSGNLKSKQDGRIAAKKKCDDAFTGFEKSLDAADDNINTLTGDIQQLNQDIAAERGTLQGTADTLKEDQEFLMDLTKRCEERARVWDQRSEQRNGEITAIAQALAILTERVQEADKVNQRALLSSVHKVVKKAAIKPVAVDGKKSKILTHILDAKKVKAPMFLQERRVHLHLESAKKQRVATVLQQEGGRLKSDMLNSVATSVLADPFAKVKELIEKLINRLLAESNDEISKKGLCDMQLGKAKKDREHKEEAVAGLLAHMATLKATITTLTADLDVLTGTIKDKNGALTQAQGLRDTEKAENLDTIKTAKEGRDAVAEAIQVLKAFYSKAGRTRDVELSATPEGQTEAGFSGVYKGSQDSSNSVIGLLEVIHEDFERTIRTTTQNEEEASRSHVAFTQENKETISSSEKSQELKGADKTTAEFTYKVKMDELTGEQELLDAANKEIELLMPSCVDTAMNYDVRVQKREEEIAALRTALCHLDPEKKEDECQ